MLRCDNSPESLTATPFADRVRPASVPRAQGVWYVRRRIFLMNALYRAGTVQDMCRSCNVRLILAVYGCGCACVCVVFLVKWYINRVVGSCEFTGQYYTVLLFQCSCFSAPRRRVALFSVRPHMRTVRVGVGERAGQGVSFLAKRWDTKGSKEASCPRRCCAVAVRRGHTYVAVQGGSKGLVEAVAQMPQR